MYAGTGLSETVSLSLNLSLCLSLLTFCLSISQGMDPVVRQVGQHIEMEPEWEAAFTLQMKLTHIISMIQEWCSADVSLHLYTHVTLTCTHYTTVSAKSSVCQTSLLIIDQ